MAELITSVGEVQFAKAPTWVAKLPSAWVRGPAWDGFWILSALWLAPIVLWLTHGYADPESSPLDHVYFALTALFWIGHRLCSAYLALLH